MKSQKDLTAGLVRDLIGSVRPPREEALLRLNAKMMAFVKKMQPILQTAYDHVTRYGEAYIKIGPDLQLVNCEPGAVGEAEPAGEDPGGGAQGGEPYPRWELAPVRPDAAGDTEECLDHDWITSRVGADGIELLTYCRLCLSEKPEE